MQSNEDAVYDAIKDHFHCDKPHRRTGFVSLFNFPARIYAQVVWQRYGQGKEVILTLVFQPSMIDG